MSPCRRSDNGRHATIVKGMGRGNIGTAGEMKAHVGKIADMPVGDLRVTVKILDARERWGRTDVLVTPLRGEGQTWKALDSLINLRKGK